ncbi:STAS domain-containing protein [Thalassotalea mangrovi]|uniref:STAS domain-containing protein n=1 Tax=Thalassotalea mangrovi TaxID=2572245 RepID=A0A4U1BBU0_9GAMM|nr:STAS domain-containing protein [Thalassotalea mangrovi]TKB47901.1 STAS domain-containing protein [Thalassotalea mangrovi]
MTAAMLNIERLDAENVQLTGELTRKSIIGKQQRNFLSILASNRQGVDLKALKKVDTAGLGWLLALTELASKKQIEISYSNPPAELVKLARLSRVEQLLPITEN